MRIPAIVSLLLLLCSSPVYAGGDPGAPCSDDWNRWVDQKVVTGDGQGHGPDLGSGEWQSVVEFKLGIRGQAGLPERGSDGWCQLIDQLVREQ